MSDVLVRFLYGTHCGRLALKMLVNPTVSNIGGRILSSHYSKVMIKPFIESNGIDMNDYLEPDGGFSSFNDFFIRRKTENIEATDAGLICPCDGYLTCLEIDDDSVFKIKNTCYSLFDLLGDRLLAMEFSKGYAFIFRLMPHHYHRYHFCADGRIKGKRKIEGIFHSVRPICHNAVNVYVQYTREYCIINSSKYGNIIQMEIGALMVGRIINHQYGVNSVSKIGKEKGYFEFGGSTIVILANAKKEKIQFPFEEKEISVSVGDPLIW